MNNNFLPSVVEIIYVAALLMRNVDDWPESFTLPLPIMCIILGCNKKKSHYCHPVVFSDAMVLSRNFIK
jgi:hypothetical protein